MKQQIYLILGIFNVALGAAGILLPLLPTTPFLLLAAFLFARSSEGWHQWLLANRYLGPYIHLFRRRSGLTPAQKLRIGASFSVLLGISFHFASLSAIRALLVGLWLFWIILLVRFKTAAASVFEDAEG